ncbi:hypothetical protein DFH29DRAFT_860401 [Suillus ampliporus]|nr:hypothetical protein DFH29DRAFT_860401 [Suillus ampliporus]
MPIASTSTNSKGDNSKGKGKGRSDQVLNALIQKSNVSTSSPSVLPDSSVKHEQSSSQEHEQTSTSSQRETLCTLLANIPPLIPDPSSQDYTWAFFCRSVPLFALFDSPSRGPLPIIQLGRDRARLIKKFEARLENSGNTMSWLHGPAGTGKSVIAYSLASHCRPKEILAGSFFFSRRHSNSRSARCVVLALAYQLGLSQLQAKEKILAALNSDPGIISSSRDLHEQFARLFLEPLEAVDWRSPSKVFVIDAIDQCQDLPDLILLFTQLLFSSSDAGLHIVITSRDQAECVSIKRRFISENALDDIYVASDMKSFLRQSFDKIYTRHRLQCRKPWPPDDVLNHLVDRVGPHFIAASIIVKFIESPDHDPMDGIDLVHHLPVNPSSPLVDELYKCIISTSDDLEQAYLHLTIVANVAGMLSCSQLNDLLHRLPNQRFDITSVLSQLPPLVHIPAGDHGVVQVCHESLYDFLSDPVRCGKQYIPQGLVHRLLAYSSLSVMMEELPDDSALCSRLSRLATESSSISLSDFNRAGVLSLAAYSPPKPLRLLSTLWHIMQDDHTGLTVDPRTKFALGYFCCTWRVFQDLDLSPFHNLPAFHFLESVRSLPVLLAFPIFLSFESPGNDQTLAPSTLRHEPHIDTLDAVAEIVNHVHCLQGSAQKGLGCT